MNLHDEVLRIINQVGRENLVAIRIIFNDIEYGLSVNHTEDQLKDYLLELDISYNDPKSVYGCIWFNGGLWVEKNAGPTIDGYWHFYIYPNIPEVLNKNNGVTITEL